MVGFICYGMECERRIVLRREKSQKFRYDSRKTVITILPTICPFFESLVINFFRKYGGLDEVQIIISRTFLPFDGGQTLFVRISSLQSLHIFPSSKNLWTKLINDDQSCSILILKINEITSLELFERKKRRYYYTKLEFNF